MDFEEIEKALSEKIEEVFEDIPDELLPAFVKLYERINARILEKYTKKAQVIIEGYREAFIELLDFLAKNIQDEEVTS